MSSIDDFHAFKSTSGGSGGSGGSGCSGDLFTWILVIATVLGSSENYLDKMQPQGASSFLGVPFCLFGYKRGCWVTAIDPRLQNLEFGYSYLAATADCIHKRVIFQNRQFSVRKLAVLTFLKGFSLFIAVHFLNLNSTSHMLSVPQHHASLDNVY